jgi:hypothetical protein
MQESVLRRLGIGVGSGISQLVAVMVLIRRKSKTWAPHCGCDLEASFELVQTLTNIRLGVVIAI